MLESVPADVRALCARLAAAGKRGWIVGGCVRDLLLGRRVADWDIATSARPEEVIRIFRRVIPTGLKHGTVTVLERGRPYEVTTLRGEGAYSDGRHPDSVVFVDAITDDLARRDFTVNAIALDALTGEIIDPFEGREDLAARVLRAVGDPLARFGEDGLRPLRACRFAATLEFEIEERTKAAIPATLETFRKVSAERIRDEWMKSLGAGHPSRAFRAMLDSSLLGEICPDLAAGAGCAQNRWHAHDVFDHTMASLDGCDSPDPVVRLAVLLHDIGKPRARAWSDEKEDWTFYEHDVLGARLAEGFLRRIRAPNDERERVVHLVRHHLVFYDDGWSDSAVRRFVRKVGTEALDDLLAVMRADAVGRGIPAGTAEDLERIRSLADRVQALIAAQSAFKTSDLAIDGRDIMAALGIGPGPKVGKVLAHLLERVLDDPTLNDREKLLTIVAEVAAE
ncbi:MAG: HD domain-containing protein [Deltaproteobacteria bacterium]|nr:HD domain-containing protein [Deltaproteobacteria bacterium]